MNSEYIRIEMKLYKYRRKEIERVRRSVSGRISGSGCLESSLASFSSSSSSKVTDLLGSLLPTKPVFLYTILPFPNGKADQGRSLSLLGLGKGFRCVLTPETQCISLVTNDALTFFSFSVPAKTFTVRFMGRSFREPAPPHHV